jgi:SP family facilitated glucose transporter-like MFS transporter 8
MANNRASGDGGGGGAGYESGSDHDDALQKPLLRNSGCGYRIGMGSRQSCLNGAGTSIAVLRESHVPALLCTFIVALGPLQLGFTNGYSSPTQDGVVRDLNLSISEVRPGCSFYVCSRARARTHTHTHTLSSRSARPFLLVSFQNE